MQLTSRVSILAGHCAACVVEASTVIGRHTHTDVCSLGNK